MTHTKQTILIVCGPTASGKTSFALEVAKELLKIHSSINILSVDSRQVYKDLDIITGKDIPADLPQNIHFFGLNIFDIAGSSNLADFLKYSQKVIDDSINSITPLIIVGGTGLYLKAITQNLSDVTIPQDLALRKEIENLPLTELQSRLLELNPEKYNSLNNSDINNPRRLIRAIEISTFRSHQPTTTVISGLTRNPSGIYRHCEARSAAAIQKNINNQSSNLNPQQVTDTLTPSPPTFLWLGFMPDKTDIAISIHRRVAERLQNGAVEEVKSLLDKNPDTTLPIYSSLGVSQIIAYLKSEISLSQLEKIWSNAEIDYARRQIVWFKKQPGIIWYDKSSNTKSLALEYAKKLTKNHEEEKTHQY